MNNPVHYLYVHDQLNNPNPHLAPCTVVRHTVYRQGNHLHTALLKLIAEPSSTGQLGRAHRGEVTWVREQDAPSTKERR